ncbi:MAG: SGNH/GDSL hydrolase family protein [Lachnospiraceae bacterium]|nr:SGNH/GDSL hydrolase family protein [Lachnospiraceae bacterium]
MEKKNIAFLGDSFTARALTPHLFSYIHPVTKLLGCNTLNFGVTGTGFQRQNGATTFAERVELLPEEVDYIIVFGGVNDFGPRDGIAEFDLGSAEDAVGTSSFYGQVRLTAENLLTGYPAKKIGFITPARISTMALKEKTGTLYGRDVNSFGYTLWDYVNAIKTVCREYAIPCLDLYDNGGFNDFTLPVFTDDGLHPNELGSEFLARKIAGFIEAL